MRVRVACCQIAPDITDPAGALTAVQEAVAVARGRDAQIILLPELATTGYVFESAEEARSRAVPAEAVVDLVGARAGSEEIIVCGFCELAPDGQVFNSVALIEAAEVRAVYRKLHLWHRERRWFSAGERPAPVVDTRYGRIGLAICYDLEFPELTRGLALGGADLIAAPTNWPRHPDPPDGRPMLHSIGITTAYLNKLFVAICDRSGTERGLHFEGGSVIASPDGRLRAGPIEGQRVEVIVAECDLAQARDKRRGEDNDVFADRRAEHYSV
jgi:5-aminopentanamidase